MSAGSDDRAAAVPFLGQDIFQTHGVVEVAAHEDIPHHVYHARNVARKGAGPQREELDCPLAAETVARLELEIDAAGDQRLAGGKCGVILPGRAHAGAGRTEER